MHWMRKFLWPFSLLYGAGMWVRNLLYDWGWLDSFGFPVSTISIGNLSTGGTGKTPHVEYLIRLLQTDYKIATLSRGYGRASHGFLLAMSPASTDLIGDEPMQYFSKFKNIQVCVAEDRVDAIDRLLHSSNKPQIILLDDAFQHRRVKPGLSILMIEYDSVFKTDFLLPAGNLREFKSGMKRADVIVVSKSPVILVNIERKRILDKIKPLKHQQVFFSYLKYGELSKVMNPSNALLMDVGYYLEKRFTILLISGIANPSGLIEFLRRHTDKLENLAFSDHHEFSVADVAKIQKTFHAIANPNKIIVTTEKDAMRMRNPRIASALANLPIFFIPVEVAFHQDMESFNTSITDYVGKTQADLRIHTRQN